MEAELKIRNIIDVAWSSYIHKVASGLLKPENEKMMQLQFALILQTIAPIFEYHDKETIKILLEIPALINGKSGKRIIDIVIYHNEGKMNHFFPIELKCFREYTRDGTGKKRGAQNLGMFDYWADIENIEQYSNQAEYSFGTQLTLTDDIYYVYGKHKGSQVSVYSTNLSRKKVTGILKQPIANRPGFIELIGIYSTNGWEKKGNFYFVRQEYKKALKIIK